MSWGIVAHELANHIAPPKKMWYVRIKTREGWSKIITPHYSARDAQKRASEMYRERQVFDHEIVEMQQ